MPLKQHNKVDIEGGWVYTIARMSTPTKSYKDTIFLPDTTFPMRGDLTTKEPARLEKWENEKLYERITGRKMVSL